VADEGNNAANGGPPAGQPSDNNGAVPPIPQPINVGAAPTWVMIVGAAAGLMTLAGFFGFAFLSATNPAFACNSFTLLAPIFAFGAALAVAFIGGSAAINGQLGDAARRNAIAYSAGGGIAVFFIAFILFQMYQPQNCGTQEATLNLTRIKQGALVAAMSGVWQQREDEAGNGLFSVKYLIKRAAGQRVVEVTPPDGGEGCSFNLEFVADLDRQTDMRKSFEVRRSTGNGTEVNLVYTWKPGNRLKAASPSCFTIDAVPMAGYLAISPNEAGAVFGLVPASAAETDEEMTSFADPVDVLGAFGLTAAFAQEGTPSFADLRDQLLNADPNVRVSARQYLAADFARFGDDVVKEIMDDNAPAGDYLGNLLSALISGIDAATEGRLAPGQARDLTQQLPYIAEREQRIVELTAHDEAAVRKQARRLIQRFPVDAFAAVYAPILEAAGSGACDIRPGRDQSQSIIYSAVFFAYNRIIQNAIGALTKARAEDAEQWASRTLKAADCLQPDLRVDSALIYYGLSTLYGEAGQPDLALKNARQFLATVEGNGGEQAYYFHTHFEQMQKLVAG